MSHTTEATPQEWLKSSALPGDEHSPKMLALMEATGLKSKQIREYFHNCKRRMDRLLRAV